MPRRAQTSTRKNGTQTADHRQSPALFEYARASRSPLHILVFLLPLIIIYEVGLAMRHTELATTGGVRAWTMLAQAMQTLGVSPSIVVGYSLPAAVIITVLLFWQVLEKRAWKLRPAVVVLMAAETVAWMVPLLLFAGVLTALTQPEPQATHGAAQPLGPVTLADIEQLSWQARLVIAIGAGLYEELLFRMALLALLHAILADLCRLSPKTVLAIALPLSSIAFMLYHDVWTSTGIALWPALLYLSGGLYLGAIYLLRGFGLAVGTHACYNTTVLVLLGPA
ncbi:MAG: CPBP family intramembrane metalloprotease [Phycisphaeraceae bacterium]|nr:CPBP family intramembrane metalloprotease [Phycisphaeraceae bacterium]